MKPMNLEELREAFPLFTFEPQADGRTVYVKMWSGASMYAVLPVDSESTYDILMRAHRERQARHELMAKYPHLYISTNTMKNGTIVPDAVWVKRDGKDGESMGYRSYGGFTAEELQKFEVEADAASQQGMFYCSGHHRAEPIADYGFFYFAGKFCKQWGEEHPDDLLRARSESYN